MWESIGMVKNVILRDLHVLIPTEYEKTVWYAICMYVHAPHVRMVWCILFIFDMNEFSHHKSVATEYKCSNPKN
jgi:hypothetical protein